MARKDEVLQSHAVLVRMIRELTEKVDRLEKRIPVLQLLEPGVYEAIVLDVVPKVSKAGSRRNYVQISFEVVDLGTKLWYNIIPGWHTGPGRQHPFAAFAQASDIELQSALTSNELQWAFTSNELYPAKGKTVKVRVEQEQWPYAGNERKVNRIVEVLHV